MKNVLSIGYSHIANKTINLRRKITMRKAFEPKSSTENIPIPEIQFDMNCRHEIIPILVALQHLYSNLAAFEEICELIKKDILGDKNEFLGSRGLDYWEILVLAAVRLGCNLDYDALQDLANNHIKLRQIMGLGPCNTKSYPRSTIHGNLQKLSPETLMKISEIIVKQGHELCPNAAERVRGDSFVVPKDIHYPTDTNLIYDGIRKVIELSAKLSEAASLLGWRQHKHLLRKIKKLRRKIENAARRKGANREEELKKLYEKLTAEARSLLQRAMDTITGARAFKEEFDVIQSSSIDDIISRLMYFILSTETMCQLAERRVIDGEKIPNPEKLFSLFEPYTELINRGKTPYPIEFGHRVLLIEDRSGFIVDFKVMGIGETDEKVLVDVMKSLQERLNNQIKGASFDKGFWKVSNLKELSELVETACLPKKGKRSKKDTERESTKEFGELRKWHPGVESAIHALVYGNGLIRCRDRGEEGYERYVALAVLGRNLHTLGNKLLNKMRNEQKERAKAA